MKKPHLLFTCYLFISFLNASAQTEDYIGIKGGISIPNLSSNGSEQNPMNTGYSSRVGSDLAIFFEKRVTKVFSIVPMFEYSSQGGKKDGLQAFVNPFGPTPTYLYANYKSEAKLNYLMLAALAKFSWPLGPRSPYSIYADGGPFGALLISAHQYVNGSSAIYADPEMQTELFSEQSFNSTQDIKSDLHKGNFGVEGDLGIALKVKNGKLFLEGGFNYGFINIQKGTENGKNQTGAATVRIGYAFQVIKKHHYKTFLKSS
jgi:hypothetical protein